MRGFIRVEKYYTLDEMAEIMKRVGGLDVEFEQCTDEAFRKSLADVRAPDFLQQDMSQNMKYVEQYGFFQQDLEDSQKVSPWTWDLERMLI